MAVKVVEIKAPDYEADREPDYMSIGSRVDAVIGSSFEDGRYVVRSIGSSDHPDMSLDDLTEIILAAGSDKYDASRKEVAHADFRGYDHDFQGGPVEISGGRVVVDGTARYPSLFGDIMFHFNEYTLLDRGYAVRIDLLLIYYADSLEPAQLVDAAAPRVREELERYLFRFKDPSRKAEALAGLVRIRAN